jgi:UBX domain-containing protein 1
MPRPGGDEPDVTPTAFSGRGVTLGGDDTPSRVLEDPRTNVSAPAPRVRRVLHLWQDGFSVDDGALYRYDDPANADTLRMINSGRAPLDLLNVEHGQEVDLELDPQKEKKYVQPKKQYKPFSGSGQRLGSPTPGATAGASSSTAAASTVAASSSTAGEPATPDVDVDASQPTIILQIRLGDGTRLQSRFNTTHTISDVYGFVDRARPESAERAYALMTTFPSKELDDKAVVLGDIPEFKRGGVVVQKWE